MTLSDWTVTAEYTKEADVAVLGSSLGRDIGYPDLMYFVVLLSTPGKFLDNTPTGPRLLQFK